MGITITTVILGVCMREGKENEGREREGRKAKDIEGRKGRNVKRG